jgi:hypothetical protein
VQLALKAAGIKRMAVKSGAHMSAEASRATGRNVISLQAALLFIRSIRDKKVRPARSDHASLVQAPPRDAIVVDMAVLEREYKRVARRGRLGLPEFKQFVARVGFQKAPDVAQQVSTALSDYNSNEVQW